MRNNDKKQNNAPKPHKKRTKHFFATLLVSTLALSILQFSVFLGTLFAGGEFSYIKRYAYDSITEKTENRKNYVENILANKMPLVYEAEKDVNKIAEQVLEDNSTDLSALQQDKNISKQILHDSTDTLINLMKRGLVNDAYIVLDTGDLYASDGNTLATVYIRDVNITTTSAADNKNLFLEAGSSDISKEFDIMLDSAWTSHLQLSGDENGDFGFYYKTYNTAKNSGRTSVSSLGYWSGFSSISSTGRKSMRYTLPLVSSDGTVYGVIGIGLMEKTIQSYIPGNDLPTESSCYILAVDRDNDDIYRPELHSGAMYQRLVDSKTVISHKNSVGKNVYDFNADSSVSTPTVGTIKNINIYNADSPYKNNQWAIVSISGKGEALSIYTNLVRMFVIAFALSGVITILCTVIINRHVTRPVTKVSKTLRDNKNSDDIIKFSSSGIAEIDQLTDAIQQLQINVKEQSSRVSKIISMSVVGIGAFMYDTVKQTVFISESMIQTLGCDKMPPKDTTISFRQFMDLMADTDERNCTNISGFFKAVCDESTEDIATRQYPILTDTGEQKWFRLSLRRDGTNILGLVQDVTRSVLEMKKVKYERDYDVTTGILNRRAYYNKIEKLFREPEKLKTAAFLMFDIDNLKYVNDTYGHDFGDDYITATANVLKNFQYSGGIVARMSGDEFNVFLYGFESRDEIRKIIQDVKRKLEKGFCILSDGTHYKLRASGGVSWYPDDSTSYEMLIRFADFAMYTIKHSTKGSIAEFDMSAYTKDSILITGVEEMNRIIDTESIKYAFQSIISVKTGKVYGYEALMRPQSEVFKAPLDLIRIAKTSAKLYEIERLTWKLALRTFHKHIDNDVISPDAKIFVNSISNYVMKDNDLEMIESENRDILSNIVLEVLESEETNIEYVKEKQRWVRKFSGMTALDDFGSGYNSEYALITLQPDIIKIDRSIISGCDHDGGKADIITKLVQISSGKNILVLAEGVETYSEMETVIKCGVDLLQGYYFGKPSFDPPTVTPKTSADILRIAAETKPKDTDK